MDFYSSFWPLFSSLLCQNQYSNLNILIFLLNTGLFVFIDLSAYLDEPTFEAETRLRVKIEDKAKVLLTPGELKFGTNVY